MAKKLILPVDKTEKTTSINLNDVIIVDLEGLNYNGPLNFVKTFANHIFAASPTIPLSDKARELYKGGSVELTRSEVELILIISEPNRLTVWNPWVIEEIKNHFKEKLNSFK